MFGVTHPWMLVGLAAVGLPVLVHFLTRPRPRTIRFPTYHLLVQAGGGRQSMHRLRTWIVLALRTLAIAALALAFARPYLKTPSADVEPGEPRRIVLVVDASMSMRAVEGGVPLFTKARAQAADLLRSLEKGSSAGVIYMGATARPALPALSRNLSMLHESLAHAEPTLEKGDPPAALAEAKKMLGGSGSVYVFSDFQRTNWGPVSFGSYEGLTFFLRPVTERAADNVGIVAVEKSPGEPIEGETIELTCTVFNATAEKRLETVRLDMEGVTQNADVEIRPYSSGAATFSFSLPTAGYVPGRLSLARDDLNDDNVHYFKVDVRRALEVLLISDAEPDDSSCAAFFVELALSPSEYAGTGITVTRRNSQEVDEASLERADAFFIVAPVQLRGETVERIAKRVGDGAALACFLDGPTAPAIVSALEGASRGAISPPYELQRAVTSREPAGERLSSVRTTSGPLKIFASPDQGDLGDIAFRRHYLTTAPGARREEVLAEYSDGSAALALSPAGRGAAIYANFPVEPAAGDLAGHPLFPSMLHELLRALRTTGSAGDNRPGMPWGINVLASGVKDEEDTDPYVVLAPDGKELETFVKARARIVELAVAAPTSPGHYLVRHRGADVDVGVVNVDPKETDTRQLDIASLLEAGERPKGGRISVVDTEGKLVSAGVPKRLWPLLAALAAGCLAAEMLLLAAWRKRHSLASAIRLEGRAR